MSPQEQLVARLDALARALADAGVEPQAAADLMESASVATAHALTLDQLGREAGRAAPPREPVHLVVRELPEPAVGRSIAA